MDSSETLIRREAIDPQIDAGKVENSAVTSCVNSIRFLKPLTFRSVQKKSRKLVRLTCQGDLHDPKFPSVLRAILAKLRTLLFNGKNPIKVTKVEPWNSVRVTLNLSEDAARKLRQLAESGDENLREIGILSVQLDGQQVISLVLPNQNITNNNHSNVTRNNQNTVFSIENSETDDISNKIVKDNDGDGIFDRINGNALADENGNSLCGEHQVAESSGGPMAMAVDDTDVPDLKKQQPNNNNPFADSQKSCIDSNATMMASSSMDSVDSQSSSLFHSQQPFMATNASSLDRPQVQMNFISKTFDTSNFQDTAASAAPTTLSKQQPTELSNLNQRETHQCVQQVCVQSRTSLSCASNSHAMIPDVPPPAIFHAHQSGNPDSVQQQQQHKNLVLMSQNNSSQSQTNTNVSPSKLVPITSSYQSHPPNINKPPDHLSIPHHHQQHPVSSETCTSYPPPPDPSNNQNDLIAGNMAINESPAYQRKSNISYHHHSMQTQVSSEQMFTKLNPQPSEQQSVNQSTNSSDILGPDVDDDLLDSVAATGTDPNDFTDLNDLNLLSMLEEMETGPANQASAPPDNSVRIKTELVSEVHENKGPTADETRPSMTSTSSQFYSIQTLPAQASGKSTNLTSVMSESMQPPQQQSILVNNPNASSVLLSSTSINQQRHNIGASGLGSGPATSTVSMSFSGMQQQNPALFSSPKPQQQPSQTVSSSPRQIYVPARTQQSWRTSASQPSQQQSPISQTSSISNGNKRTQPVALPIQNNESTTVPAQQSPGQHNRFVASNNTNSNNGSSLSRPPLSSSLAVSTSIHQQPTKPQSQAQQQQIVVRPNASFSTAATTSSVNQQSSSANTQNAVALSSPLLVNLLQSDVPSNPSLQQQSISSHASSQQQFANSSGTQQIRLITSSEANQPIMTQVMMVRVSSAHQGTTTQIINSGAVVPVSSTHVVSSSGSQTVDQTGLVQTDQPNDGNTNYNLTTSKPKKPRKSRKKVQQEKMVETSVQTTSIAVTPTTPAPGQIVSIPNTSDVSGRMQTSSVSTFLTLPPNSMAQSLKLQSSASSNVQQALLSSQSGAHHIFNQKQRVQPVVMIAANSVNSNMDSSSTTTSNSIVSSAGGTFILTNVPAISLQANTSAMTSTATTSGVQLGGNRKQIFLATKSNSFPVSSALSAGLVARFANSPGGASSSPSFVSSPVKLLQQPNNAMANSSGPIPSTEIRSMSAPATTSTTTILTPPSNSSPSSVMSSPMQSPLPINANLISNATSTGNINTMFANTNTSSNNNPTVVSTSTMVSFCTNVSPVRASKSANAPELLLSPLSQPGGTANNSLANQSSNLPFKSFQVTKNSPSSLLLNKLSQPNQMITKIGIHSASSNKIPLKAVTPPPLVSNMVQKQFVSVGSGDPSPDASPLANTFMVKNSETSVQNFTNEENKPMKSTNIETFICASDAAKSRPEYKTTLAEMLASNNNQTPDKVESVFLDDAGQINEPKTPISPSYFLAPASAFENKSDQKVRQPSPIKSENVEGTELKTSKEPNDSVALPTTSTPATTFTTTSTTTTTESEENSITKTLLTKASKSDDGTASKTNTYDSFYVLKRNYSQDLPDHILDEDEEDNDDSDLDDFGFYSRTSHFLSGSIGSIGGGNSSKSSTTKPSESTKTEPPKSISATNDNETKVSTSTTNPTSTTNQSTTTPTTLKDSIDSCQNRSTEEIVKKNTEDDDNKNSTMANGDLSSQSSDDVKIIPTSTPVAEMKPSVESVNESIKTEANMPLDSVVEEIKPIEIVKATEPKPRGSTAGKKSRKVAPAVSQTNKPANISRRKAASSSDVPGKAKQSLLVPSSSMDSVNLIAGDTSKEKCPPLVNNEVDFMNKKQVFITVKPPHSLTTNTIQLSNPNQTIGHILQTDSSASTSSIGTSNQKFRYICIPSTGNKYLQIPANSSSGQTTIGESGQSNVLYRVPSHGGQSFGQFVVVKPVMVNDGTGGPQQTAGTQFKLIQNKLAPATGTTGTGQPLFIPMMTTANSQGVLSVKTNPPMAEPQQQQQSVTGNEFSTIRTNEASTQIEIGASTSNETAEIKNNAKTDTKPAKQKEVDTCGIQTDNSANFDLASHTMLETVVSVPDLASEASEKPANEKNDTATLVESSSSEATSPDSVSFILASQPDPATTGNQADSQALRPKDNQPVANIQTAPVSRSVHFMLSGSNSSNAPSNVVILKADQSSMVGKDLKDQSLTQIGVSSGNANPIRRQILIAKPMPYNQINSQQSLQDASQQQAIFATKSNNSITATKTLPSILRQSKRKSDTMFQASQPVSIAAIDMQTIKASQPSMDSSNCDGSTETDSDVQSTPSSSPFKTQTFRLTNQSLLSPEDDSISDISDAPSKPRKRARKSKVTTIQQPVAGNLVTIPTIYLSSSFGNETISDKDPNETTSNVRTLRNQPSPMPPLSKPAPKRAQRNKNPGQTNPVQIISGCETIQMFANSEKTQKVTNASGSRQTRSNRNRNATPEQSIIISADGDSLVASDGLSDQSIGFQTHNMMAKSLSPILTDLNSLGPMPTTSFAQPTTQQFKVVSVTDNGEHLVSLLEGSTSNINAAGNNSLLVKRSRKSLPSPSVKPALRNNASVTEPISTSTSSPAKRRRLTKDVVSK